MGEVGLPEDSSATGSRGGVAESRCVPVEGVVTQPKDSSLVGWQVLNASFDFPRWTRLRRNLRPSSVTTS